MKYKEKRQNMYLHAHIHTNCVTYLTVPVMTDQPNRIIIYVTICCLSLYLSCATLL